MQSRTAGPRRIVGRRAVLRGAGAGLAGIAGAVLVGCGGSDDVQQATTGPTGQAAGAPEGRVPADQVRVPPGEYDGIAPATPAEQNPLANGRYGGTLMVRYLDPPHMDFNRTLSCTINTTMDYVKNKLTRAKLGPLARPEFIDIEPDLAESWELSDDATRFTFHLHPGATFHNVDPVNGRAFVAEDVRLSVERYQGPGVQRDVWADVVGIETPDDRTVTFQLSQPAIDFPRNIAAWSHMDAREVLASPDLLAERAIGTGPFIQEEWTQKERSIFVRNPNYFEEGLPFVDRLIAHVQEDTAAFRAGFQTDNFHHWTPRDPEEARQILAQVDDAVYLQVPNAQGANTSGMHFQMANPKWQDERIRRALSMAIDRMEWDIAATNGDTGGYSSTAIPWQVLHDSFPSLESQGEWYQFNVEEARRLLQAAGYSESNRLTIDAPVWYYRTQYQEVLGPMYAQVPEIEFQIRVVDNPTAVTILNDRNFEDTVNITWGPPAYSVDQMVFPWYHSQGGLNHNNVDDPAMDRLLEQQRAEPDPEAQLDLWRQIDEMVLDQVWDVFFPKDNTFRRELWHNYMVNFRPHGLSTYTCYANGQARAVWLDEGAPSAAIWPPIELGTG